MKFKLFGGETNLPQHPYTLKAMPYWILLLIFHGISKKIEDRFIDFHNLQILISFPSFNISYILSTLLNDSLLDHSIWGQPSVLFPLCFRSSWWWRLIIRRCVLCVVEDGHVYQTVSHIERKRGLSEYRLPLRIRSAPSPSIIYLRSLSPAHTYVWCSEWL